MDYSKAPRRHGMGWWDGERKEGKEGRKRERREGKGGRKEGQVGRGKDGESGMVREILIQPFFN